MTEAKGVGCPKCKAKQAIFTVESPWHHHQRSCQNPSSRRHFLSEQSPSLGKQVPFQLQKASPLPPRLCVLCRLMNPASPHAEVSSVVELNCFFVHVVAAPERFILFDFSRDASKVGHWFQLLGWPRPRTPSKTRRQRHKDQPSVSLRRGTGSGLAINCF